MKKTVITLVGLLILFSCSNKKKGAIEGTWIDKKSEFFELEIFKEKDSLWLKNNTIKYLIQENEKNYECV